jgi:hypothetical protein
MNSSAFVHELLESRWGSSCQLENKGSLVREPVENSSQDYILWYVFRSHSLLVEPMKVIFEGFSVSLPQGEQVVLQCILASPPHEELREEDFGQALKIIYRAGW